MADMEWPTEEELLAGRMKDGSRPPLHSAKFKFPIEEDDLPIKDKVEDPQQVLADDLKLEVERQLLDDLNRVTAFGRFLIAVGFHEQAVSESNSCSDGASESPSDDDSDSGSASRAGGTPASPAGGPARRSLGEGATAVSPSRLRIPGIRGPRITPSGAKIPAAPHDPPEDDIARINKEAQTTQAAFDLVLQRDVYPALSGEGDSDSRAGGTPASPPGEPARRSLGEGVTAVSQLSAAEIAALIGPEKALSIGEKGARLLLNSAEKRAEVAKRVIELSMKSSLREEYYYDRAHGICYATLCALDEAYEDIGFGGWMPFRYIDQWLMFCGVMRRVLAANGLIHSNHAETYRKLLEETPPVEHEGRPVSCNPPPEEVTWSLRPPSSWGKCFRNRGVYSMDELKKELDMHLRGPPRF